MMHFVSAAIRPGVSMPRLLLVFVLILGLPVSACTANEFRATPISLADHAGPGDVYAGIRLLGALRLANVHIWTPPPLARTDGCSETEDRLHAYIRPVDEQYALALMTFARGCLISSTV